MDDSPLWWTVDRLVGAYANRELSPVEVVELAEARIEATDSSLHAYVVRTPELARRQAREAERAYRDGDAGPLAGVPTSIKDAFDVAGQVTTYGSLVHADDIALADSGAVRRMRESGATFVGKTNVSEFCQSATADNLLGPETVNPWNPATTSGGSSGGAAASVAGGTCTLALGSDGGGSIRIPASFCGLVGLKPTYGRIGGAGGLQAFSPFISAGPLARTVSDATRLFEVLTGDVVPAAVPARRSIAWCSNPEGRPVERALLAKVRQAAESLCGLGHRLEAVDLQLEGWEEIFGPLVLAEEGERRGHLLEGAHPLTRYERRSLEAARELAPATVHEARSAMAAYRERIDAHFEIFDVLVTPATATPAFEAGRRPDMIAGRRVGRLWGAFPFAVPFNVSGHPSIVLPVGLVDAMPVAMQLVGRRGSESELLQLAAELEAALDLDLYKPERPTAPML